MIKLLSNLSLAGDSRPLVCDQPRRLGFVLQRSSVRPFLRSLWFVEDAAKS